MKKNSFKFWQDIWTKKGLSGNVDLRYLDGYDHLDIPIDPAEICGSIRSQLDIKKTDMVLEVACGAGFLTEHMKDHCIYQGVDYCWPFVELNRRRFNVPVFECESSELFYPNSGVDFVFAYGLFQYLPSSVYARTTIQEMVRVARKGIFIGDIRTTSKLKQHMTYSQTWFGDEMRFSPCIYDPEDQTRFNAYVKFDGAEDG